MKIVVQIRDENLQDSIFEGNLREKMGNQISMEDCGGACLFAVAMEDGAFCMVLAVAMVLVCDDACGGYGEQSVNQKNVGGGKSRRRRQCPDPSELHLICHGNDTVAPAISSSLTQ